MNKDELKQKILEFLKTNKYTSLHNLCPIGVILPIDAKDVDDLTNPTCLIKTFDTLCELEAEGKIVNSYKGTAKDLNTAMIASKWYLK
ncbi:hypothetical protein ACJDU8_15355 [Clostridium sp. WILCCON 0269]|uniref:Uncharacterized protein n=1 Tax=Candidatus Clostridium eludens TaxID=3381663 RepID=A0ABW8SNY5_9CLOT